MSSNHPYRRSARLSNKSNKTSSPRLHEVGGGDRPPSKSAKSSKSKIPQSIHNTSIFSNSNVTVTGGSFAINNMTAPDAGFIMLSQAASKAALHDSSERYPPPKCHPDTRQRTIDFFVRWIKTQKPSIMVYWLHAPFGHGKSAVMQSIMDRLVEEGLRHLFAGGFFFGRGITGRDKITYLFATIAYQIALFVPGMREYINSAMLADPTLPSKSPEIQLQELIIGPLFQCADGSHFHHSPTVFIDGLDECDTIDSQVAVLDLVASALLKHHIPLRFLIASRPEAHIRDAFHQNSLSDIAKHTELPDDDAEMTVYLQTRFDKIYDRRARFMTVAGIQKPWPSQEVVDGLVRRASGQYIFLGTVLRFIGAHRLNPVAQLKIILDRLSDDSVFTDMDSIYRLILEQCPPAYQHILTVLISNLMHYDRGMTKIADIADFWQINHVELQVVVETLAAVVEEDPEYGKLSFHHRSFQEFLEAESRSANFCCNTRHAEQKIDARQKTVFKLILSGDFVLRDHWLLIHGHGSSGIPRFLEEEPNPSELLELVRRGLSKTISDGEALFQWYYAVDAIMQNIARHSGIFPTDCQRWRDANKKREVAKELYNCCLGIWKSIADRAFAEMDSRIVKTLYSTHDTINLSYVARVAEFDERESLQFLKQYRVLFDYSLGFELSTNPVLLFRDLRYYRLQKNGVAESIEYVRKQFYSHSR